MRPILLLLVLGSALAAQTTDGDVVDAMTGAPLAGAYVSVYVGSGGPIVVTTGPDGHFLVPGPIFSLTCARAGYLRAYRNFLPKAGETQPTVRIELTPQAVISGKIEDEDGFPVPETMVLAMQYRLENRRRKLRPSPPFVKTNDLGEYRLAGLPAGSYYLLADVTSLSNWDKRYVPQFYPGTPEPREANLVRVSAGEERRGIDLRVRKQEGVTVEGNLVIPVGSTVPRRTGFVDISRGEIGTYRASSGFPGQDGSFEIRHVPPGNYVLRWSTGDSPPRAGDLLAEQAVEVGGEGLRGVVLTAYVVEAVDLEGRVTFEAGTEPHALDIGLRTGSGGTISARTSENGSFVLKGVLPGQYQLMIQPAVKFVDGRPVQPASSEAISAQMAGQDVLDSWFEFDGRAAGPLEITVSSHTPSLYGTLLDAAGRPITGGAVLFQPIGTSRRAFAVSGENGKFWVRALQPGAYRVYAVADQAQCDLFENPDYLKAHENDFAPLMVVRDRNPSFTLKLPAR